MYKLFEGDVSIADVDGTLYVNKFAHKWGNKFTVPEQTEDLVAAIRETAKERKAKIGGNTTQTKGKDSANVHSVAQFDKLAEEFQPVVAGFGAWRVYLAFQPNVDTKAPRAAREVKLAPNAIVIK